MANVNTIELATTRTVRVELTCLYCGHALGEYRVATRERPTYREVRQAVESSAASTRPTWDAHGAPRCPRCRGKLFIEVAERPVFVPA